MNLNASAMNLFLRIHPTVFPTGLDSILRFFFHVRHSDLEVTGQRREQ